MNVLAFTITVADWSAIAGSLITIVTVVGGFWKWAKTQAHSSEIDNATTGAQLRAELREENKRLREENTAQYKEIRALQEERDKLEEKADLVENELKRLRLQRTAK